MLLVFMLEGQCTQLQFRMGSEKIEDAGLRHSCRNYINILIHCVSVKTMMKPITYMFMGGYSSSINDKIGVLQNELFLSILFYMMLSDKHVLKMNSCVNIVGVYFRLFRGKHSQLGEKSIPSR